MTTLYLIRHCEAVANVKNIFQGQADGDVTEKGLLQLRQLEKRAGSLGITALYSSPLKRARLTAEAVARGAGINKDDIQIRHGLREIDAGELELLPVPVMREKYPAEYAMWVNDIANFSAPRGESFADLYLRVAETIDDIVRENPDKSVAVIGHGAALYTYLCRAHGCTAENISGQGFWSDNTGISIVTAGAGDEYNKLYYKLNCFNDTSHLSTAETKPHMMFLSDAAGTVIAAGTASTVK